MVWAATLVFMQIEHSQLSKVSAFVFLVRTVARRSKIMALIFGTASIADRDTLLRAPMHLFWRLGLTGGVADLSSGRKTCAIRSPSLSLDSFASTTSSRSV